MINDLTIEELDEMDARANAMEPGPYEAKLFTDHLVVVWGPTRDGGKRSQICHVTGDDKAPSSKIRREFFTHVRDDFPRVSTALRAAWAEIDALKAELEAVKAPPFRGWFPPDIIAARERGR